MAEKGFGVKEVNLIGASGTPTITSPNNLNLNANNVAISTNVSIGGTLSVTGNVSVGGTLTYEDVTNIDSVGLITARTGVKLPDSQSLTLGTDDDAELKHTGSNLVIRNTTGNIRIEPKNGQLAIQSQSDERTSIYFSGSKKFETTNTGAVVTGILTATTFSGSGASLTNVPAATPTNSDIQVVYTVTANGASAYRFAGNGVVSSADNPDLYLIRGQKYRFINNSGGSHPFQIREASGGTAYSTGVTNNGAASGNIDFAPTYDSPAQLVYQCTAHGGMVGNIYLRDAAGNNTNVGVTTFSGFNHIKTAVVNTAYQTIESTASNSYPYLRLKNDAREYQLTCHGGLSDAFTIYDGTATVQRFTIDSNGNIGINDTTPPNFTGYKSLSIHGSTGGAIVFGDDGTNEWEIYGGDGAVKIYDRANTQERIRITDNGEIGLGGANYGSSGQVLTSQGSGSAVVWADAGITMVDQWRITSSSTLGGSVATLNSNWSRVASPSGYGNIGSAMSESSGVFTFPSTGVYLIQFTILLSATSSQRYLGHRVQTSINNFSSAQTVAEELGHMGISNSFGAYHTSSSSYIFDVTNTSTHKIRFAAVAITPSATDVIGNANQNSTFATFIRLGDT